MPGPLFPSPEVSGGLAQVANMQNPTPDPRTLDRPTPYIGVLGKIGRCVESAIPWNPSIEKVGVSAQHTVVGTDGSVLL